MKELSAAPNGYAGCYTLDLYCKYNNPDHRWSEMHPGVWSQYLGETFGECASAARADGWVIHKDRTATCPRCAKR